LEGRVHANIAIPAQHRHTVKIKIKLSGRIDPVFERMDMNVNAR
jgi:hypothetical protein